MIEIWLRGRLCRIEGYVDGPDPHIGLYGSIFIPERIVPVDPGPRMLMFGGSFHDDLIDAELECNLSNGEIDAIDEAFWETTAFEESLPTYQWREEHPELDENWEPRCGDPRDMPMAENE